MALTDAQKLQCKLILEVRTDSSVLDSYFAAFTATEEAQIGTILTSWTEVQTDTDLIKSGGLDSSPERQRRYLKRQLCLFFGMDGNNVSLGRA